ncbi:uncharacterized protein LOC142566200 [Dermacentor variabilis]|uniref:uncharacterized protein LOC142566200 n=1 Tax=Dermacentor variabilis TaxID=34621 RepID=UPI003F5C8BDD
MVEDVQNSQGRTAPTSKDVQGPPTTHPNCPRRARQTLNKAWVRKALEKEQRELQPSSDPTTTTDTAETRTSRAPTKETRKVRSETRSRSRRKFRTRSKSRSRSHEASVHLPEKRPPSPSSQQSYKKALQTNAPAKVTLVPSGVQRTRRRKQQWRHLRRDMPHLNADKY